MLDDDEDEVMCLVRDESIRKTGTRLYTTSPHILQGEPVAWIRGDEVRLEHGCWTDERAADKGWIPLYAAPQEVRHD